MFNLNNRKFLITGASGGIGQAIAKSLYNSGATVCLTGTREDALRSIFSENTKNVFILPSNLFNSDDVNTLVEKADDLMSGLDGLICNAGITRDKLSLRMSDEDWADVINLNLNVTFKLNRDACRILSKNRWGRIINISSIIGLTGNAGQANYSASKAGMIGMSKSMAKEFAGRGITVNCIAPGFIDTPMTAVLNDTQKDSILSNIPMKRMGTPEDVAAAVVFLASEEANYITGHVLNVNGGLLMF